jgi:DNA replication licensing factor MCM2
VLSFKHAKGQLVYSERIKEMCDKNLQSLEINYVDLSRHETVLAYWIADEPSIIIPYLNQVAFEISSSVMFYPGYSSIH